MVVYCPFGKVKTLCFPFEGAKGQGHLRGAFKIVYFLAVNLQNFKMAYF